MTRSPSRVTVIGCDGSQLPPDAQAAVAQAHLVVGGRRHLEAVDLPAGVRTVVLGALDPAVAAIVEASEQQQRVVVLASGDPGLFGIVRRLRSQRVPLQVLPAVSSVAAAFGRLGVPWDDAVVVSAHGRDPRPAFNTWRRYTAENRRVAMLTDATNGPVALLEALGEDFNGFTVMERLGHDDERVTRVLPSPPASETDANLLGPDSARQREWREPLLIVSDGHLGSEGALAPWLLGRPADGPAGWALPDDAFEHRDGMLTKREVRAVVLARLAPAPGALVWDVGAGSGSVGVECARLGAAVIAIEQSDTEHIARNAEALQGLVRIVQGKAPDALVGLPQPDAVFVGGGGPEVVTAVAAVRPDRVVVALATLERVAPTVAALEGYEVETVLLQVSRLEPLGEGHRLVPANPVFVVSGVLP